MEGKKAAKLISSLAFSLEEVDSKFSQWAHPLPKNPWRKGQKSDSLRSVADAASKGEESKKRETVSKSLCDPAQLIRFGIKY